MVREPLEGSLRNGVEQVALGATTLAITLMGLALVGELLRRRRRAPNLVATLDRLVPGAARATAVALIATLPLLAGARAASADDSVGAWLRGTTTVDRADRLPQLTRIEQHDDHLDHLDHLGPGTGRVERHDRPQQLVGRAPTASGTADCVAAHRVRRPHRTAPTAPATPAPSSASAVTPEHYSVQPGDCLWSIAQRRLPVAATNRDVDAGWRAIYVANRAAIGPDPDLIHVGLDLVLPPLTNLP